MRYLFALAIGIASITSPAAAAPADVAAATTEDARFEAFGDRIVDEYLKLNPIYATAIGEHRYDALMPDVSAKGRASLRSFAERSLAELARFDEKRLSREPQVDAIMLKDQLDYIIYSDQRLKNWSWDPLTYGAGDAFFSLMSREFAPLPERLRSATGRLEALPAYLAQSREALVPARVPLIHAQTAAKQNPGLNSLIDELVAKKSALPTADQARLERAAAAAKAAVAEHQTWLDKTLIPNAKGNERLGATLYDEKLRLALESTLSRQEIRARAEREIRTLRSKMYQVAAGMIKGDAGAPPAPANPTGDEEQAVIEAGLAKVYADVPPRDAIIPFAKQTLDEAIAFAKQKDLVGFPTQTFNVIEMPEYARGVSTAYADMPGALEKDQRGYFDVMPIPPDWSAEQTSSFLREYNKWGIYELALHEGVPGHLLQLAHSNQYKSKLRAVLASGPMIEGWACYGQDVMADAGYLGSDPRYLLAHYKSQMRMPVNAMLDFDFHTGKLTREQAMELMTKTAFQQEREAAGKWVRLQLSSAQLPVYFVGYQDWKDFRAAAQKRPGFSQRKFHDSALSHGSPSVRFIRELELGEPIR